MLQKIEEGPARPGIEVWLAKATEAQRIALDEYLGVLDQDGDSGSVWDTLEALIAFTGLDYVRECLDTMEHTIPALRNRTCRVCGGPMPRGCSGYLCSPKCQEASGEGQWS